MEIGKLFKRTIQLAVLIFCLNTASNIYAQNIEFDLRLDAGTGIYEVYVRPDFSINPPLDLTVSSQATIVAPAGQPVIPLFGEVPMFPDWGQVTSNAGPWGLNARINSPPENPEFDYITVGLREFNDSIAYSAGVGVLVFSFTADQCLGPLELIVNNDDPFDIDPNSANSNPGNQITVLGLGNINLWSNNYNLGSANCIIIEISDVTVDESAGNAVITVSLVDLINGGPATSFEDIMLTLTTTDGTAQAGSDYSSPTLQITIPAGSPSTTISVPITDDLEIEADETFTLSVQSLDAGQVADFSDSGTQTILDNDSLPDVTIDDLAVYEDVGLAPILVNLSNLSNQDITLALSTIDGSASDSADYAGGSSIMVTIQAGSLSSTAEILIMNDGEDEACEAFEVTVTPIDPSQVGDTSDTATVLIMDIDSPAASDDSIETLQDRPVTVDWDDNDVLGPEASLSSFDSSSLQGGVVTDIGNGSFTYQPPAGFQSTDTFNYEVCDLGPDGTPSTGDEQCDSASVTSTVSPPTALLNVRVFLQGAYSNQNVGLMRDDLRIGDGTDSYVPIQEPYSAMNSFTHVGAVGGTEVVNPAMFSATGPDAPVDWVFVELRDANDPSIVVATRSGLLQRDGDVMDVDGITGLLLVDVLPGDYHVVVRHRNHICVMTESPVGLSGAGELLDFTVDTTANFVAVAGFAGQSQKTMPDGKLALWGGNGQANNTVIFQGPANDPGAIFFDVLLAQDNVSMAANFIEQGYRQGDYDMDGQTIFQGPGNDVNFVFFNVLLHAVNFPDLLANFVIPEQAP